MLVRKSWAHSKGANCIWEDDESYPQSICSFKLVMGASSITSTDKQYGLFIAFGQWSGFKLIAVCTQNILTTVKPVMRDHPIGPQKVVLYDRWFFYQRHECIEMYGQVTAKVVSDQRSVSHCRFHCIYYKPRICEWSIRLSELPSWISCKDPKRPKGWVGSLQLIQQGCSDNQIDHKLVLGFISCYILIIAY